MTEILLDTWLDTLKLFPFLFVTYVLLEYLEHYVSGDMLSWLQKSRGWSPLVGSVLGAIPQCGISAAVSGLYAARVVTLGTLLAVYLSTSDEMLPILLAHGVSGKLIVSIVGLKICCGLVVGLAVDWLCRRVWPQKLDTSGIVAMCQREQCSCGHGVWQSALWHTVRILAIMFVIMLMLNGMIDWFGQERLGVLLVQQPVLGVFTAAAVGLLPNCAPSVLLTELYLAGILPFAQMFAGLLVNGGAGLLVLFSTNGHWRENLVIVGLLYGLGTAIGLLLAAVGWSG